MVLSLVRIAGCPIRRSPDQSLLTAPRGISVFAPSFIGSWRLGIPRVPLLAFPHTLVKMLPFYFPYPIFKVQLRAFPQN